MLIAIDLLVDSLEVEERPIEEFTQWRSGWRSIRRRPSWT
jgi:hypothetical protein